jgi:TrmH family RNA methyltransferase
MIESVHNEIIKKTLLLKNKKDRDEQGLFLVEGIKQILEIQNDWEIVEVFATKDLSVGDIKTIQVSQRVMEKLSCVQTPQGIVAVVKKRIFDIGSILEKDGYFILLENISDPGNLGTIIRCGDAFGAGGVFVSKGSADIYSDKVLRSTMGSIFHLPVIDNIDTETFLQKVSKLKIKIFASGLKTKKSLTALKLPTKSMILIGNESKGLTDKILDMADGVFKIPMAGKAESLNAAIAAGIIMYEVSKR